MINDYTTELESAVPKADPLLVAEVALHGSLPLPNSTSSVTIFGRLAADQKLPFRWREVYHIFEPNRRDIEHYTPQEITRRITQLPFNVRIDRQD
ncbi:hypothetical protein TELCIR_20068 [Teladorsagia circumcincta]|uniref:Uncharacterized protein n=1 Tax=Teladorsagia circumcincta TaxID=45464 RepID=A0A2G9TKI9_TELCI|nr:hypothetical protein TELCIR_20068 [Teladorsagia circumcincta]